MADAESINEKGEHVVERDWDNLIILDGCRLDTYRDIVDEAAKKRISRGGSTPYFIRENFGSKDVSDIICIAGNPHYADSRLKEYIGTENPFYKKYKTYMTGWSDEESTVMPHKVKEDALQAEKHFPDRRKIIHFMQPHEPFIGSDLDFPRKISADVWLHAELGLVDDQEVKKAYAQNLDSVMHDVWSLVDQLSGKTVISADHGELLGEHGFYGHYGEVDLNSLREVPWHRVDKE